ncbi:tetratricopeptide repeat protein [Aquimarina latercula]|uniref:tetratricopeptide repeat protein n=1 Tax=Aquimarina latercula TaxID=987 RepID=UPI0003FEB63A|nr:tetratricopeptide repeat protein [Aquimarina latercula]
MNYLLKKGASYDYVRQGSEIQKIYFDSVISIDSTLSDVWSEKSSWSIKEGDYIDYFEFMNKAVKYNPNVHIGWRGAVRLYYLRDYEGAINDFNQLIKFNPNVKGLAARGEPVLFLLGKTYWQMKEYKKAIEYFDIYIEEEVNSSGEDWVNVDTFLYKSICLYEIEKYNEALESINKAIKYYQTFPEAYYHKGAVLKKLQKNKEACENFSLAFNYSNYIKNDAFREVFGQLYKEDISVAINEFCKY